MRDFKRMSLALRGMCGVGCCCVLVVMLLNVGCLKRPPADKKQFVIDVTRPVGGESSDSGIVLQVRLARVSPMYESPGFVYKKGDGTYEQDFYNEFFTSPGYIFTEELRQWFSNAPFVKQLSDAGTVGKSTHALSTRINALYGDYSGNATTAVLEMEFNLVKKGEGSGIVFHKVYSRVMMTDGRAPDDLVRGWTDGLEEILLELESDLAADVPF